MSMREPPKRNNLDRFVYFLTGVAIGCVMLGLLWQVKARMARKDGSTQWQIVGPPDAPQGGPPKPAPGATPNAGAPAAGEKTQTTP